MMILPAIDLQNRQCVRLERGDFGTATQVAQDALETARRFEACGAQWLHMVDLDGSRVGMPMQADIVLDVVRGTGLYVEVGGGVRDMQAIERYLCAGAKRVVLGSVALKNPALVRTAAAEYGARVAVGIDARDGMVATEGWLEASSVHYIDLAREMQNAGVQTLIFTDIGRDGMLSGPNLEQLKALRAAVSCDIIASGGIRDVGNIRDLRALSIHGAICGKSIYAGTLDLEQAIQAAKE